MALNGHLVKNLLLERQLWLRQQLDPRRDIDAECGHPSTVTVEDYKRLFERGDIAARVVEVLPKESWSESPEVFETEDEGETAFELAWDDLVEKFRLYSMLERVDTLSGIGRFGILLLGIDDGLSLDQPAAMSVLPEGEEETIPSLASRKLLYLRPFDEALVQISSLEKDQNNPRYGQPTAYQIRFEDASLITSVGGTVPQIGATSFTLTVHWSRIIHVADNRMSSDVYGIPRMQKVLNRLLDIKKIAGGSGEMFWKGGFPGLSLEAQIGEDENVTIDLEATKEELDRYMNGLQRYLATVGMQAKSLAPQVADPTPSIDSQIKLIAMTLGVPHRVLMGSEAAQLASEQDSRAWNRRLGLRREEYLTPYVIKPTVDRLIALGVLPRPAEYQVFWPDLNTLSEAEKASVAERQTNAIARYVQTGADLLVPPFHFLTLILGWDDEEARAVIDEVGDRLLETDPDSIGQVEPPPQPGQPGNGRPANGQPANRQPTER